jgi:sulfoxide reductase heme-binding subunit YedZ
LVVTSLVREHIGYRTWRAVHWAAYACWPLAILHGLGAGTDTRLGWAIALNLGCLAAVAGTVWWRIVAAVPSEGQPGVAGPVRPVRDRWA